SPGSGRASSNSSTFLRPRAVPCGSSRRGAGGRSFARPRRGGAAPPGRPRGTPPAPGASRFPAPVALDASVPGDQIGGSSSSTGIVPFLRPARSQQRGHLRIAYVVECCGQAGVGGDRRKRVDAVACVDCAPARVVVAEREDAFGKVERI